MDCFALKKALVPLAVLALSVPQVLGQQRGQRGAPAAATADTPPTEAAPRWPDGRVNLGSTSDKKGYWEVRPGLGGNPRAADVPFQEWARALYQYRTSRTDMYPPLVMCKPSVGPGFFNAPGFEIVDVPEQKKVFLINIAGPHSWRVVHMDGRPHPTGDDLRPTFFGHSVGRWEGDTLVIDSVGFNEKQWFAGSYPITEKLHLTERISRPNLRSLTYEYTVDDPGAYTGTWGGRWTINEKSASSWMAGAEVFEYICQDSRF
jgi:hypothetical protein